MQNRMVLDIGAFSDLNKIIVASDHCPEPDTGAGAQHDFADKYGIWRHEPCIGRDVWANSVESIQRHDNIP